MNDWRKDLTDEECSEIDAEDVFLRKQRARQRKRAQDAMRRSIIRAGNAAIKLSAEDKSLMFDIYLEAQVIADFHRRKVEVDHLIPLKACCRDEATGRAIHYACGLHVPQNLRAITLEGNRVRTNLLPFPGPFIIPADGEYDPYTDTTQREMSLYYSPQKGDKLLDDAANFLVDDDEDDIPF